MQVVNGASTLGKKKSSSSGFKLNPLEASMSIWKTRSFDSSFLFFFVVFEKWGCGGGRGGGRGGQFCPCTPGHRSPTTTLYWSLVGISAGLTPLKPVGPPKQLLRSRHILLDYTKTTRGEWSWWVGAGVGAAARCRNVIKLQVCIQNLLENPLENLLQNLFDP